MIRFVLPAQELMWFNIQANLGSYLDGCDEVGPALFYAYSKTIPDAYCNLGFTKDGGALSAEQVQVVERAAATRNRGPAIWQISEQATPKGYDVTSREVWMVADTDVQLGQKTIPGSKVHIHRPLPTPEMVAVFDEVYCQSKGDTGYTAMDSGYVKVYRKGTPNAPAKTHHIGISLGDECVAIAAVTVISNIAGLYSVAVSPRHRRKALGD